MENSSQSELLAAGAIAEIQQLVAERLRDNYLNTIQNQRDTILSLAPRGDNALSRRLQDLNNQQLQSVEELWNEFMQNLETDLPKALDLLFKDLRRDFEQRARSHHILPPTPPTRSKELPILTNRGIAARERSATPQGLHITDFETSVTEAGTPPPLSAKRALNPTEPVPVSANPKKKAKRTPQTHKIHTDATPTRSTLIRDCRTDECIFKYGDVPGYYVLRCHFNRCKERLDRGGVPIYFTSHPFRDGLAMEHFGGEGHSIRTESEVFRKFARRVTDADGEQNADKTAATATEKSSEIHDKGGSSHRDGAISPAPLNSREKGKQAAHTTYPPFGQRPTAIQRLAATSAGSTSSCSPSKQKGATTGDGDTSYHPTSASNALFSASCSTPSYLNSEEEGEELATQQATQESLFVRQPPDDGEDGADDNSSQPFRRFTTRGQAYPDYTEKPPNDEEFK